MMQSHTSLQLAVQRLRSIPFPKRITDDQVGDLHADLADFDGYTGGLLEQVLAGRKFLSHPLKCDPDLRFALEQIRDTKQEPAKREAIQLLTYLDILEHAVVVAQEYLVQRTAEIKNPTRA